MKKFIVAALVFLFTYPVTAQVKVDTIPSHLQNLRLPDFKLLLTDSSSSFYTEQLNKKKTTILMSFSPDCDHCKNQTKELIENIEKLKSVQIVMATTYPFEMMKQFYNDYQISKYKNIIMGRDVLYFFPKYYRNHYLPLITIYSKKGELLHYFDGGLPTAQLIQLATK
ncbi:AhpC/TSA family protein [Lacibacter cauensis]|uniref:AhpC/TSA family protein n=1 Tax=Lacibacter cauensis TaxID=510947 RepID=A0A562SUB2_9BACT|nr:redoxin domain-containing protein [Lacibacter cauensis]TWI84872.1 AhpC/TSA family protein [Lacibacter cauensis]